jgi:hypothetical protein
MIATTPPIRKRVRRSAPAAVEVPSLQVTVSETAIEKPSKLKQSEPAVEASAEVMDIAGFRQRMLAVSAILDCTLGSQAALEPELWRKGAYLILISTVVTTLVQRKAELSTAELVNLARVLEQARSRRGLSNSTNGHSNGDEAAAKAEVDAGISKPLPPYFADVVRQIYGTDLTSPGDTESSK